MKESVAVIICSYGEDALTIQALADLCATAVTYEVCIVDNMGTFPDPRQDNVRVLRPASNLGWARGSNLGILSMLAESDATRFVLLNNDVRLSVGFLDGLQEAHAASSGGVIAPAYDHNWPQQRIEFSGSPADYEPRPIDRVVPFVDGTCMSITRSVLDSVGLLDVDHWPLWGWGCDKDFCLRVRQQGQRTVVTERSFLSHIGRVTATTIPGFSEESAEQENDVGMATKWGPGWRDLLYEGFGGIDRMGTVQARLDTGPTEPL